ncbi:MAG: hypothetical protein V7785_09340 [Bermanella sp.]
MKEIEKLIKQSPIVTTVFVIVTCLLLILIPYFTQFHNGFSTNQMHWGAFGGYISGTFGTILTILSIASIVYFNLANIKRMRAQDEMKHLESRAEHFLDLITKNVTDIRSSTPICEFLIKNWGWDKDGEIKITSRGDEFIQLYNIKRSEAKLFPCGSPLELYLKCESEFGRDKSHKFFFEENAGNWLKDFKNFESQTIHLLAIVTKMINGGYSVELSQSILSIPFNYATKLHSLNEFDNTAFQYMKVIQSAPTINLDKLKLDTLGRLMTSLKENGYGEFTLNDFDYKNRYADLSSDLHIYVFTHKKTGKKYTFEKNNGWKVE